MEFDFEKIMNMSNNELYKFGKKCYKIIKKDDMEKLFNTPNGRSRYYMIARGIEAAKLFKRFHDDDGLLFSKPKNCGYEIYLSTDSHGRKIYPLYGSWLENNGKLELLKRYGKDRVFPQLKGIKYTIPRYLVDACDECGKYLPEDSLISIDGLGTDFYCCPDCAEKVRRYSYKTCKEISEMEA